MFHVPDFIGSFYYEPETGSMRWDGMFGMFIEERRLRADGSQTIKGRIGDDYGNATFEGVMSAGSIEFTKTYDAASIAAKNASPDPVHYRGERRPDGAFVGEWTRVQGVPFENLDPYDRISFILLPSAPTQTVRMLDSDTELTLEQHCDN